MKFRHHDVFTAFRLCAGERPDGFETDFLGCRIRHDFWPVALRTTGLSSHPPFDSEYVEWIALLESVVQAKRSYTMIELGAGFGRWMVRAAVALRQHSGLPCRLVGVEPEPAHSSWIPMHFRDNGIDPADHQLIHAAVSDRTGHEHFYVEAPEIADNAAREWYGQCLVKPYEVPAVSAAEDYRGFPMITHESGYKTIRVRTISLDSILHPLEKVDLVAMDIQGADLKVISAAIQGLTQKVKRLLIGTHSREIEEGLRRLLPAFDWKCDIDYRCGSAASTPWGTVAFDDGVQSWTNMRWSFS